MALRSGPRRGGLLVGLLLLAAALAQTPAQAQDGQDQREAAERAKARKQCESYFSPEMSRSMTSCGDALEDLADGGAGAGSCPASCGGVLNDMPGLCAKFVVPKLPEKLRAAIREGKHSVDVCTAYCRSGQCSASEILAGAGVTEFLKGLVDSESVVAFWPNLFPPPGSGGGDSGDSGGGGGGKDPGGSGGGAGGGGDTTVSRDKGGGGSSSGGGDDGDSGGVSAGVIAGAVVGGVALLTAAVGLFTLHRWRQARRRLQQQQQQQQGAAGAADGGPKSAEESSSDDVELGEMEAGKAKKGSSGIKMDIDSAAAGRGRPASGRSGAAAVAAVSAVAGAHAAAQPAAASGPPAAEVGSAGVATLWAGTAEDGSAVGEAEQRRRGGGMDQAPASAHDPQALAADPLLAVVNQQQQQQREQQREQQQQQQREQPSGSESSASARPPPPARRASSRSLVSRQGSRALVDLSPWEVQYSDLQIQRPLGAGSFGSVYLAAYNQTSVAVKLLGPADSASDSGSSILSLSSPTLAALHKECGLMAALRHPNVVLFLGVCYSPPGVITEYCARGSLYDVLQQATRGEVALPWTRRLNMALDAAKGMLALHVHSPPIVHRDLKSPNLLVDAAWRVKVADFNLSRLLEDSGVRSSSAGGMLNPRWLAPEVLAGGGATAASDIFSFGVVLWELLTWQLPWEEEGRNAFQVIVVVGRGERLRIPPRQELPGPEPLLDEVEYRSYVSLIQRCWAQQPNDRPTFDAVASELRALVARRVASGASSSMLSPPPAGGDA